MVEIHPGTRLEEGGEVFLGDYAFNAFLIGSGIGKIHQSTGQIGIGVGRLDVYIQATACVSFVKIKGCPDTVFIVGLGIAADPTAYSGLGQQKLDFMVTEQIVWLRSGLGTVTFMGLGCVASGGLVVHLGIRGQGVAALIGIEIILGQATFLGISGPSTE